MTRAMDFGLSVLGNQVANAMTSPRHRSRSVDDIGEDKMVEFPG